MVHLILKIMNDSNVIRYTSLDEVKTAINNGVVVNWENGLYIVKIDFDGDLVVVSSNGLGGELLTEKHLPKVHSVLVIDLEKEIIEKANLLCESAFMDFPEYDKENPITTLAEALTAIVWDSLQLDCDSSEVYDFINEKLNK